MGERIKQAARAQMVQHGTAGISLRGIARELDITAPAIYNYYPRLDDLITALIVDAFIALADASRPPRTPSSPAAGWPILASCLAYREWAIAHRWTFQLIPAIRSPVTLHLPRSRYRWRAGPSMGCSASSSRPTRPASW
jgi:AcrR family transcriptional regulator